MLIISINTRQRSSWPGKATKKKMLAVHNSFAFRHAEENWNWNSEYWKKQISITNDFCYNFCFLGASLIKGDNMK